jgi:undecaprenyl pyrophosphate phosphatase UppP
MNKNEKRELKKQRKMIYIFLAICLPIMLVLAYLLYRFAPSLVNQQWIVVALIVVFGLVLWFGYQFILKKQAEKNAQKPKKKDPYAD